MPDKECVRVPISCGTNADCIEGFACRDTMCIPKCGTDQECALNEKCLRGNCMCKLEIGNSPKCYNSNHFFSISVTCRVDNDCFLGHICLNNKCSFGCHADEDCSASETCRNNKCINPCSENPCGPNAVCTVANQRASCSCVNNMLPSPTAKIGCVRAPATECTANRECGDGLACVNEMCRPVCANDDGCLNSERCINSICTPQCRRDNDCQNGEVCQGLTCVAGCRSDQGCPNQLSCINQQCTDPCTSPTACGTNALCDSANHRKLCSCPEPLVGDPDVGCHYESQQCGVSKDCPPGHSCVDSVCQTQCRSDQNCLSDERCLRSTCRAVCNSDASCGQGQICEKRLCTLGCRTDSSCASEKACINNKCSDPCEILGQCGACSQCEVVNHGVQCKCPSGLNGNPLSGCSAPVQRCNSYCTCDESGVFCAEKCSADKDCLCGQTCHKGKCREKCNPGSCPPGQLCQNNACMAGCRSNSDCTNDRSCINNQCLDPCLAGKACGKDAQCTVSDHRALCLCPDGFQGEPTEKCVRYECQTNDDCEHNKKCLEGSCRNPCTEPGSCGINAQCRVVNRQAQCSCPPGYFGNARQECQPLAPGICKTNPCGENAVCKEVPAGYECMCAENCVGDPKKGCLCRENIVNSCEGQSCGENALCRTINNDQPECYCPHNYPIGDPYVQCKFRTMLSR
jgi:hypothetical protein